MRFSQWIRLAATYYCLIPSIVSADTVQQLLWNTPSGDAADLSLTFTNGQTLPLSWNNWTTYTTDIDASTTLVDLWVSSFDWNLNQYAKNLKQDIDLQSPGSYAWTIDIGDDYLSTSAKYVLRFKVAGDTYMENTPQLSSPGFLVLRAGTQTTSSASSASSVSSSSSIAGSSFATSSAASDLPPAQTSQSADGLTTGAKSGIGVGVALGGLVLIGVVAAFVLRRRRETVGSSVKELDSHTAEKTMYPAQPGFAHPQQNGPYEMPSQHAPAELGNS